MGYKDKDVQREYQRVWRNARREAWLKEHGPCLVCGTWDDLEVDHKDRTLKIDHKVWSWAAPRRNAELAKCQVLCRKHHLEKGRVMGEQPAACTHGVKRMYESYGCRCPLCREAHRSYQVEWRRAKRAKELLAGQSTGR